MSKQMEDELRYLKRHHKILHSRRRADNEHGWARTIGETCLDHGRCAAVHSALHKVDDVTVAEEWAHLASVGLQQMCQCTETSTLHAPIWSTCLNAAVFQQCNIS